MAGEIKSNTQAYDVGIKGLKFLASSVKGIPGHNFIILNFT
jgi:hypothetical protein